MTFSNEQILAELRRKRGISAADLAEIRRLEVLVVDDHNEAVKRGELQLAQSCPTG